VVAFPQISTMSPDTCRIQLGTEHVGRVGLPGEPPDVIPVNYEYDEDAVIIRVDSSSVVARHVGRTVSFEVDHYDDGTQAGWSVLAASVLEDVTVEVAGRWATERQVRLYPWAPGNKDLWLRVRPIRLSGRSVRAATASGDDNNT